MNGFTHYALLGAGKVARHLQTYLNILGLPYQTWSRGQDFARVQGASHFLLAVSDPAIAELATQLPHQGTRVHFSGIAKVQGVYSAHPLMTFGSGAQSVEWYKAIPFVVDKGVEFNAILPGFPNAAFAIDPEKRPLYHALCALSGNSTFLLWQKIAETFRQQLQLPPELLAPFLHQVVTNSLGDGTPTGPVSRGDWPVVRSHLDSLGGYSQLQTAYRQFLNQAALGGQNIPEALL